MFSQTASWHKVSPRNIAMFDMTFYPEERGPYNYDTDPTSTSAGMNANGFLNVPSSRWGGIMRPLTTTDFEQANIEDIQFWLMDPFNDDALAKFASTGGDLYFDLGNISEDILPDSRKAFENGIPSDGTLSQSNPQITQRASISLTMRSFPYRRADSPNALVPFAFPAMNHLKDTRMPRPKQVHSNNANRSAARQSC